MEISEYSQFFIGLLATLLFAWLVSLLIKFIKDNFEDYNSPKGVDEKVWKKAFKISGKQQKPIKILGFLEAVFFFISFYFNKPQLIAGWLTFKLASKWQTWSTISKIPEKIKNVDDIEYIGAKNSVASHTLQRWFIGTLGNILAGCFGLICGKISVEFYNIIVTKISKG